MKVKNVFKELEEQLHRDTRVGDLTRARSVTIGTAFGGVVEVSMRANNGSHLWCVLQPVEAIELIHQLAASVGCHIHIKPRKDFASYRNYNYTEEELKYFGGNERFPGLQHPPHTKGWHENQHLAATLPPPEQQPGLNIERNQNEPVATKKTVNRRSTKRAAATA